MKLNHVQHRRFVACVNDLKELVILVGRVVPATTIGKEGEFTQFILENLKKAPFEKYLSFDVNQVDLSLRLKVNKKGIIMGFAEFDGTKRHHSGAHFKLNNFIEGSALMDPDVEYYETA